MANASFVEFLERSRNRVRNNDRRALASPRIQDGGDWCAVDPIGHQVSGTRIEKLRPPASLDPRQKPGLLGHRAARHRIGVGHLDGHRTSSLASTPTPDDRRRAFADPVTQDPPFPELRPIDVAAVRQLT